MATAGNKNLIKKHRSKD